MSAPYVYLDTETTGLDPYTDDIWEIAWIVEDDSGFRTEYQTYVRHDLARAATLPREFRLDWAQRYESSEAVGPRELVGRLIATIPAKAHLVGACPWFDQEFLRRLFEEKQDVFPWHYHLIDVEALAVGWLRGKGNRGRDLVVTESLPWSSEALSRAVGVDPLEFDRHSALGDALWAEAIHRAVMA